MTQPTTGYVLRFPRAGDDVPAVNVGTPGTYPTRHHEGDEVTQPTTDRHVHVGPILGPTFPEYKRGHGYLVHAEPSTPVDVPPLVYVRGRDGMTGRYVALFITPADARAFAAQLVAAADTIDPNGASQ